jgi:hypothetical protein
MLPDNAFRNRLHAPAELGADALRVRIVRMATATRTRGRAMKRRDGHRPSLKRFRSALEFYGQGAATSTASSTAAEDGPSSQTPPLLTLRHLPALIRGLIRQSMRTTLASSDAEAICSSLQRDPLPPNGLAQVLAQRVRLVKMESQGPKDSGATAPPLGSSPSSSRLSSCAHDRALPPR